MESCSHSNECSWAEISLMSAQSTTMCEVGVESYVELEMVCVDLNFLKLDFNFFLNLFRHWLALKNVIFHQVHRPLHIKYIWKMNIIQQCYH